MHEPKQFQENRREWACGPHTPGFKTKNIIATYIHTKPKVKVDSSVTKVHML